MSYEAKRQAYTLLVPWGVTVGFAINTLCVIRDDSGNSLYPDSTYLLPVKADADVVEQTVTIDPAVVNAASGLPGVSRGSIIALYGTEFLDAPGRVDAPGYPLPTELAGVMVTVNGLPAPLLSIVQWEGRARIDFQGPRPQFSDFKPLTIVVRRKGSEETVYVKESPYQLGIYGFLAHAGGDAIDETNPARVGERIKIYWTGLSGHNFVYTSASRIYELPDGVAAPYGAVCVTQYLENFKARIGGKAAEINACAAAPGLAGIGLLEVTVPGGLKSGEHDVQVTSGGIEGNIVKLVVQGEP